MANTQEALSLILERPNEPLILPKGGKIIYDYVVPDRYLNSRYRALKKKIKERFEIEGMQSIVVKNISIPDISVPMGIPKQENFSLFFPKHSKCADVLVDIFMKTKSLQDLLSTAAYCRDRLNPFLFNYALSVAILHREDTKDVVLPNFATTFPGKFVDSASFTLAFREAAIIPEDSRVPIIIPRNFTAGPREPEQRVAYFREDMGINLHHWHWHLVYPFSSLNRNIVDKDRRGELFYYMHHQILARYNTERFCNDLDYVIGFENVRESIVEGYFPKLHQQNSSRAWPPRFVKSYISDLDRPAESFELKLSILETWISNIKKAIADGTVVDSNNTNIKLTDPSGIDILGNIVEATVLSVNRDLYGNVHNMGHVFIALCHDPQYRFLESFSVMGDTATAMRDPIFYRWHKFVNDLFLLHKDSLPYYPRNKLDFTDVSMNGFQVTLVNKSNYKTNELHTFWEQTDMDMSRGLDFSLRGPLFVRFSYLQHDLFQFTINVKNASESELLGTVRLFMAPKNNRNGDEMQFEEQRKVMIELDKFRVVLKKGDNVILRSSEDSNVVIPYAMTFRSVDSSDPATQTNVDILNYCGCGWPQHMMIPKGTIDGYPVKIFAMVSNHVDDAVDQDVSGAVCAGSDSYCGILNMKYPDKRSMGYPFDRPAKPGVVSLTDFLTPNMNVIDAKIFHTNTTTLRPKPSSFNVTTNKP